MAQRFPLFTRQSPQKLKSLKEHALIESAVSSNRIEGVEIEHKRIGTVIFGKKNLQDHNEEELRGYQKAMCMNCKIDERKFYNRQFNLIPRPQWR